MGLAEDIVAKILQPIIDEVSRVFVSRLKDIYQYIRPIINDVALAVWNWVGPYVKPISDIATNFVNFTMSFSAKVYSAIQPFISQIIGSFSSTFSQITSSVRNFIDPFIAQVVNFASSIPQAFTNIIHQVQNFFINMQQFISTNLIPQLTNFTSNLGPSLTNALNFIPGIGLFMTDFWPTLEKKTSPGFLNITGTLGKIQENLSSVSDAFKMVMKIPMMGPLGPAKFIRDVVEKSGIFGDINISQWLARQAGKGVVAYGQELGKNLGVWYNEIGKPIVDFFTDLISGLIKNVFIGLVSGGKELTPSMASSIESLTRVGTTMATSLVTASVVGELAHPTKELQLGRIANLAFQIVGWREMSRAITDPIVKARYAIPLTYDANVLFRPKIVNEMALKYQFFEGVITKEEFYREMAMYGYSDVQIDRVFAEMFYEPSVREMCLIFDAFTPPEAWAKQMLRARGLGDDSIDYVYQAIAFKAMKDEIGTIKSIVASMYVDGFIEKPELVAFLEKIRFSGEWRDVYVSMLDMKIEAAENKAEMEAWIEAYKKFKATEAETLDALVNLGMRPRIAAAKIQKIKIGMKERGEVVEKRASLTKGEILSAYKERIIQENTARERLEAFGYDTGDIDILIAMKAPEEAAA